MSCSLSSTLTSSRFGSWMTRPLLSFGFPGLQPGANAADKQAAKARLVFEILAQHGDDFLCLLRLLLLLFRCLAITCLRDALAAAAFSNRTGEHDNAACRLRHLHERRV